MFIKLGGGQYVCILVYVALSRTAVRRCDGSGEEERSCNDSHELQEPNGLYISQQGNRPVIVSS